ncbi:MAG: ankyrin repeat domain-containing protein [Deltaproteobacteria bacterium]|nr:ankyrin repeat domain-containing protein [Deltaproteobacteria bacterium]
MRRALLSIMLFASGCNEAVPHASTARLNGGVTEADVKGFVDRSTALATLGRPRAIETRRILGIFPSSRRDYYWRSEDGYTNLVLSFDGDRVTGWHCGPCGPPAGPAKLHRDRPPTESVLRSIEDGDVEAVMAHLASGVDVNATGGRFSESLLNHAVAAGQVEVARLLIERGADIDADTGRPGLVGLTPLSRAANRCQLGCVKLLLDKGARVDARSAGNKGNTPLGHSLSPGFGAAGDCYEVFRLLLDHGADPKADDRTFRDHGGINPIVAATYRSDARYTRDLIEAGADVNARTDGRTVLEYAITNFTIYDNFDREHHAEQAEQELQTIRLLLEAGANPDERTKEGLSLPELVQAEFAVLGGAPATERADIMNRDAVIEVDESFAPIKSGTPPADKERFYSKIRDEILKLLARHRDAVR